jgi:hypothetical protein
MHVKWSQETSTFGFKWHQFDMDSGPESCLFKAVSPESSVATPMSREEKRAIIKHAVDERRRQIAAARQPPIAADVLISPTAAPPPDMPNKCEHFSPSVVSFADASVSNPDMESSCDVQPCRVGVLPSPRLSPTQQKALDQHRLRQLQARVRYCSKKDEKDMEWHASLRKLSLQIQNQQQKHEEISQEEIRKSPLSMNFDAVVKSVSTIASSASFFTTVQSDSGVRCNRSKARIASKMASSPFGGLAFLTPTKHMDGSINRTKNFSFPSTTPRSSSRQLDFDSHVISFEASPLKIQGTFAAIGDFFKHAPCSRRILSQKVSHFFILNITHPLRHTAVIRSTNLSSKSP